MGSKTFYSNNFRTRVKLLLTVHFFSVIFWIPFPVYFQCKFYIFLNSTTKTSWSSMYRQNRLSGRTSCFIFWNHIWHYHRYSHRWTHISPTIKNWKVISIKLRSPFGILYRQIRDARMKQRTIKVKEDRYFWSSAKIHNFFLILTIVSSLPFRSGYYLIHVLLSLLSQMILLK